MEEMDEERDGRVSPYHQEGSRKNPVSSLLISYFVTDLQVSHLQWEMLRRLLQALVLLIDWCCITIQITIPVSQLLLWVLRSAQAVLPQCQ